MKKILAILAVTVLCFGATFAQTSDSIKELTDAETPDLSTRNIKIEKDYSFYHPTAATAEIELNFRPLTDEVEFFYTCMAASFDQGEAMDTAIAVFLDFQRENQYTRYSYAAKDKVKYFKNERGIKMATYRSLVVFTR